MCRCGGRQDAAAWCLEVFGCHADYITDGRPTAYSLGDPSSITPFADFWFTMTVTSRVISVTEYALFLKPSMTVRYNLGDAFESVARCVARHNAVLPFLVCD